jgi:hypothetical protein
MMVSDTPWWGGQPYDDAQYVNIAFMLILATQSLPLECDEWQRRVPNIHTWTLFKEFSIEAHHENRMISHTALRSGYHMASMVTHVPAGQLQTCDVARFYSQPNDVEDTTPSMTTDLANLTTATGADRDTVAALTNSLADLTIVTNAQSEEPPRIVNIGHITPLPASIIFFAHKL